MDVHVLNGNFLLPLSSIALQCFGLGREGSKKFHREISVAVLLGDLIKARREKGDTSAFDRRTGAPSGFSDKSREIWRKLPTAVRADVAQLSQRHDALAQSWGSVQGYADIAGLMERLRQFCKFDSGKQIA
jgi:hypothetical protein